MNELIKTIGMAKTRIDSGFSKVGRELKINDPVDQVLMILSARTISLGNALTVLCRDGHANEALALLRFLADMSMSMMWIVFSDSTARAQKELERLKNPSWDRIFSETTARERATAFSVPPWAVSFALDNATDFTMGNAQGLPWGHVFSKGLLPGRTADEVMSAASIFLAFVLEALNRRWPNSFSGADEMKKAAQISRGI